MFTEFPFCSAAGGSCGVSTAFFEFTREKGGLEREGGGAVESYSGVGDSSTACLRFLEVDEVESEGGRERMSERGSVGWIKSVERIE